MERRAIGLVGLAMCGGLYLLIDRVHDVTPVREGLARAAATVCEPPPVRPVDGYPARIVTTYELDAALVRLCNVGAAEGMGTDACSLTEAPTATCRRSLAAAEPDLDRVHEALRQDRALLGVQRRGRVRMNRGDGMHCTATSPGLEHLELASVQKHEADGDLDGALGRCVAVERDRCGTRSSRGRTRTPSRPSRRTERCSRRSIG